MIDLLKVLNGVTAFAAGNINDMDLRSTTYMTEEQLAMHNLKGEVNFESKFKPDREVSIGAWIGYRGYGLGSVLHSGAQLPARGSGW